MSAACTVCAHPARETIDREIAHGAKSRRSLALAHGLSLSSLARHTTHLRKAAGAILVSKATHTRGRESIEQSVHSRVDLALAGGSLVTEVANLRSRADRIGRQAEESKDPRTALLAIRELTRLLELQGRMALEASAGRAADVSAHPAWHAVSSAIMRALEPFPDAFAAVAGAIARELGQPLEVRATAIPASELPFPD